MKKILIAYYSRTGTTKKLAEKLKKQLKADIDEIRDERNRSGAFAYLVAGKDAMQKKLTEISFKKNPENYNLVVIGTPIWSWDVTPAVRTYLTKNKDKLKKVAYFCTMGGSGNERAFKSMCKFKKCSCSLALKTNEVLDNSREKEINEFCKKLK